MKKIFVLIISAYIILSVSQTYSQPVILPEVSFWGKAVNMIPGPRPGSGATNNPVFRMDRVVQEIIDNSSLIKLSSVYEELLWGESLEINIYL